MKIISKIFPLKHAETLSKVLPVQIGSLIPAPKDIQSSVIKNVESVNAFYKKLTGLDELETHQNRVIELQNELLEAQKQRRQFQHLIQEIRKRSAGIQEQLHYIKRLEQPGKYLALMEEETEMIKKEQEAQYMFNEQERHEREIFTTLSRAIGDSQDKQRTRMEYAKYIGLGLTVLGAIASWIITTWRTNDLKMVIRETIEAEQTKNGSKLLDHEEIKNEIKEFKSGITKFKSEINESVEKYTTLALLEYKKELSSLNQSIVYPSPNQETAAGAFVLALIMAMIASCCACIR